MSTNIDALNIRRVWGREEWRPPAPFGPDGWSLVRYDGTRSIIVTADYHDDVLYVHASIAGDAMPTYADLVQLHQSVWKGTGYAYQVFAPTSDHVNIHEHALHLWGRRDGLPVLPEFAVGGSI